MGELLQSIVFSNNRNSIGWDFDKHSTSNIGELNADIMSKYNMEYYNNISPHFESGDHLFLHEGANDHHFSSTGYLEDVLFEFTSKRRRLLLFSPDHDQQAKEYLDNSLMENCWSSNLVQNYCESFDTLSQIMTKCDTISDQEAGSEATYDSSSSSQKLESSDDRNNQLWTPDKENLYCSHVDPPIFSYGANERRKKRVLAKVVYPFALVKPGGFEGDVTLNDINERILMPPTRAVRHPVGDFACRPLVLSPEGRGLSGKAVVAFTRIQTHGRGTITIIRTRG